MPVEIKPGPKLDRAVAAAIGLTHPLYPDGTLVGLFEVIPDDATEVSASDPRVPAEFIQSYSTDLDAAFAAAEKVGLFDDGRELPLRKTVEQHLHNDHWVIMGPKGDGRPYATLALAVCAATLAMSRARESLNQTLSRERRASGLEGLT